MSDFIRNYKIDILTDTGSLITIQKPFSVIFSVTRNTLASANTCTLTIKNLGRETRSKLFKDRYIINKYWQLSLNAGYDKLSTVFQGNIQESYSYKEGSNWLTKIQAYDGMYGIQNGFTSQTFNKEIGKNKLLESVIKDMPNLIKGKFGEPTRGQSPRGQVLLGQSSYLINKLTGGQYFIDNEKVNILSEKEYIGEGILQLNSDKLLTTPRRRETLIDIEMIFFAEASTGGLAKLNSIIKEYNGEYKIMGFKHDVQIIGESAGTAKTKLSLYTGEAALRKVA